MSNIVNIIYRLGALFVVCMSIFSCADDESFSTSTTDLLTFEADTVKFDTVFSKVPASTRTFWIHNNSQEGIRCSQIKLEKGNLSGFRVNVDGEYLSDEKGYLLNNVEVRKGDSIRVFVEVTTHAQGGVEPKLVDDNIIFRLESGTQQKVNLNAWSWDAELLRDVVIKGEETFSYEKPVVIYGGLKIDSLATLTIPKGMTLYFHDNAGVDVYGTLLCQGTADEPVTLRGDRLDRMFDYLPYDLVSGQWKGVHLHSSSLYNELNYTDIHSTFDGIVCDSSTVSDAKLLLYNSTIHNCQGYGLKATHSVIDMSACQITNTLNDCVSVDGGFTQMVNCTLAQFYPFDSNRGYALSFSDESNSDGKKSLVGFNGLNCLNTIVTGYDKDVIMGSLNDTINDYTYTFKNCLLRTPEVKDSIAFENVIWEKKLEDDKDYMPELKNRHTCDSLFVLVSHETQHYDFHLDSLAVAVGMGDRTVLPAADRDGKPFNKEIPDIGCYSLSTSPKNNTKALIRRRESS